MQNSAYRKPLNFNSTDQLYFFINDPRNALKLYKKFKKLKFERDWAEL